MKKQFFEALAEIEHERGIDRESLITAIEDALHSAYKKNFGVSQKIEIQLNCPIAEATIFTTKEVVEEVRSPHSQISLEEARRIDEAVVIGGSVKTELTPQEFGRISAQVAKQVIIQRIRETERGVIYGEFKGRMGEIITGVVRREHGENIYIDLGKIEGILPSSEQIPREKYRIGDRVKVYILDVKKTSRGPQVILSRTYRDLVKKLFEMEVPEIYEGLVEIKAVARDPGFRSKLAVSSKDEKIDGVGACVGMRGIRVQAIVNELCGERIDIVRYDPDPDTFIRNALAPAQVKDVIVNKTTKVATIIVPNEQLSLAIGKGGQNVRLAAKLTGWRIDIKREDQFLEEQKAKRAIPLTAMAGVGPKMAEKLIKFGVSTIPEVVSLSPEDLMSIPGIGKQKAIKIWQEASMLNQAPPDQTKNRRIEANEGL